MQAIRLQGAGEISVVLLNDLPPATYAEKFKGLGLSPSDLDQMSRSNHWQANLKDDNAWISLFFEAGVLVRIQRSSYRGPVE